MTSYHGGKQRLGRTIADIIADHCPSAKGYCEPFCGMLGVYRHIPARFGDCVYLAGDANGSVIKMWQKAQKGWRPPTTCSENQFDELKRKSADSALKGYVGHQYSFGGQWFKGYAPKYGKTKCSAKASANVVQIARELGDVAFSHGDYTQYSHLKGFVIYCDPPYDSSHCIYNADFDADAFWDWCHEMAVHNWVFVSNYKAPKGVKAIYTRNHKITGDRSRMKQGNLRVEKLYLLN